MFEVDAHLIALHRLFHDRPRKLSRLLSEHGSARDVFRFEKNCVLDQKLRRRSEADMAWLEGNHCHLIQFDDPDYPSDLRMIFDPPPLLFAAGNRVALTCLPRVAMVGARSATQYGLTQAQHLAETLAARGVAVVSGLALGIDAASHEGALKGDGVTIAVLGSGCDQVTPRTNSRLAERIQDRGLVLSELPLGFAPLARNFPRRNRIVTGMTSMTVVVEAAQKSGSLISARLATTEGKEVFALPGLITNKQAMGCHQLIKEGAALLQSAQDILEALGIHEAPAFGDLFNRKQLTQDQQQILQLLSGEALSIDQLVEQLKIPTAELMVELVTLEVMGLVISESGHYGLDVTGINAL